jgi:AraC-like DNA-binding protein
MQKTRFAPNETRLVQLYEKHARALLRITPVGDTYTTRVRRVLLEHLRDETPDIEAVADKLALSVRSLQMRLKDEGTSYQKILNGVRKNLAIACLQEPKVSMGEISQLLGFSEISVFSRTFKKWTGKSPSEYQAALN